MLSPRAVAAFTKVRSRSESAWARMRRALLGQVVRPMQSMTLTMLLPKSATMSNTRKNEGIIMNTLITSESTASTLPPK